jgi:tryptophan 7-halogenase
MTGNLLRSVVVVGDDAAAWMAAAAFGRALGKHCTVQVVSAGREPGGLAGLRAAEGTLPALRALHHLLGLDEDDFVRRTGAGFKLGTLFRDWSRPGRDYFHPFGAFGASLESVAFHHHWMRLRAQGHHQPLEAYSLACAAARAGRFTRPLDDPRSVLSTFSYGLHLGSAQYAAYLRRVAEQQGVAVAACPIAGVEHEGDLIKAVRLADGRSIEADLFIDCAGVLIADAPHVAFEDWSHWLPCDRLMAVMSAGARPQVPYTEIRAVNGGWHWRIPLRGATAQGLCYSSRYLQAQAAREALRVQCGGTLEAEPRTLSFTNGCRVRFWTANVVALGDAAGFLEPLEATNLHLVHSGLVRLLSLLPHRDRIGIERDEYNRLTLEEWQRARDFLILHYKATQRDDSPFWNDRRSMSIPEALSYKIRLFDARGHVVLYDEEAFAEQDYLAVFVGQDMLPRRHDPVADTIAIELTKQRLDSMRAAIRQAVEAMSPYSAFLARYGADEPSEARS